MIIAATSTPRIAATPAPTPGPQPAPPGDAYSPGLSEVVSDIGWGLVGAMPIVGAAMNGIGMGAASEGCPSKKDEGWMKLGALVGGLSNLAGTVALMGHSPAVGLSLLALSGTCLGYGAELARKNDL